jgi:hypothetical protein
MAGQVTDAQIGREFTDRHGDTFTVVEGCREDAGHWYCITHREGFPNQFQMHGHTSEGNHELVWMCHKHGPEVA